jgi:hypothetical protein
VLTDEQATPAQRPHRPAKATTPEQVFATAIDAVTALERSLGKHTALWNYRNANNEIVGMVARFELANGKTCRPVSKVSTGWVIGAMAAPRPLYELPELLKRTSEPVYITEGEKCADLARSMGLLGTTSSGGSNGAEQSDWTTLRGREVVVMPDHDDAGEKYAQDVMRLATAAGASSVRTIRLIDTWAGMPEGGDIVDLIEHRGGDGDAVRAEIAALLSKAQPIEPDDTEQADTDGDTWPTPLSDAAYHGLVGEIVRAIEPHTEADAAALLVQLLISFGSAAGRHSFIEADGSKHFPNMFAVLVGDSSKGRKGTSWKQIQRVIERAEPDWSRDRVVEGLSSGEGVIWAVRDAITKHEPVKQKGVVTGYQDVEVDPGIGDKRLLVQEGEFAQPLKVIQREGNTLSPILRRAWDGGDTLQSLTKTNQAKATNAHISIIGHITTHELRQLMSDTESSNGFANRFLWVCVRRSKLLPHGGQIDAVNFDGMVTRLGDAIRFAQADRRMERDNALMALFAQVYPELSSGLAGLVGKVTARSEAQVMRLALVYALLDRDDTIREVHLQAALEVWRYCLDSAKTIFGWSTGDRVADRILDELRRADDGVTRNQIRELFKGHKSSDEIQQALDTLASHGQIVIEKIPTAGRPIEIVRLRLDSRDKRHKRDKPPGEVARPPLNALNALITQGDTATGREIFEV